MTGDQRPTGERPTGERVPEERPTGERPPEATPGDGTLPITVNGAVRRVPAGTSVADVVASLAPDARGLAVAVDREVVPRARWAATTLGAGASVEVVTAVAGG